MKLHLVSDLHLEFGSSYYPSVEADAVILAGDITPSTTRFIDYCFVLSKKYKYILVVLGNHDFYSATSIASVFEILKQQFKDTNIYLLDNEEINLEGKHIFGGTLWTNCHKFSSKEAKYITDFIKIHNHSVETVKAEHEKFKEKCTEEYDLIITHFSPSMELIDPYFSTAVCNGYYHCTDMEEYLNKTKTWVYGHTHRALDTKLNGTRFICNPFGYPREYTGFYTELTFEV